MANYYKASSSSSGFVIVTTVLLLLVVINIYGAPVATACSSSSSSSKVMLVNSSSLEVVEQVAKDQAGITEFAIDDHHELIQRRVLQGSLAGKAGGWAKMLTDLISDASKPFKATPDETMQLKNIFTKYCFNICSKAGVTTGNYCACQNKDSKNVLQFAKGFRSCGPYTIYYCCGTVENCSLCCGSGLPSYINSNPPNIGRPYNQVPPPIVPSSGSPVAYVVMTVIAIFTTVSYMYVHLLI